MTRQLLVIHLSLGLLEVMKWDSSVFTFLLILTAVDLHMHATGSASVLYMSGLYMSALWDGCTVML